MSSTITLTIFIALCTLSCVAAIFGGDYATPGQFPYQVYLRRLEEFSCGGSIYNEKYIITAGRCAMTEHGPVNPIALEVVAGTIDLKNGGVVHSVKKVIVHEDFATTNDIALLELSSPLVFNEFIQPIELYNGNLALGEKVTISGFGPTEIGGSFSDKLKYNNLTELIPQPNCSDYIIYPTHKGIICIAHKNSDSICDGDSGGPAVINGTLVGVALQAYFDCGSGSPDAFASITYYKDWIKKHTSQ